MNNNQGHIDLILGPMFSGKSTELQRKVKRYQFARKRCLVVNYAHDNRYTDESCVSTHDQRKMKALKITRLSEITQIAVDFDVIAIDEGQFFPDIAIESENLANQGKIVIIAALDGTFQRKPFGAILELIPLAEFVVKLSAVCKCGKDAFYTKRTAESEEIELIGGEELYMPACRECFLKKIERKVSAKEERESVLSKDSLDTSEGGSTPTKELIFDIKG